MVSIGTIGLLIGGLGLLTGIRIIRPTHKMLVETLGKWSRTSEAGFTYIFPFIQKGIRVNITERMVDVDEQMIQTSDKLNTTVDAVVYYKVKDVKSAEYNIDDYREQLPVIARNTLRAVMGKMSLTDCIQKRNEITKDVEKVMAVETRNYGVNVLRVEIQRIEPPKDVQNSMNNVVKAEQDKISAVNLAKAKETTADGQKMADIKIAEGQKQSSILIAEGKAKAFKLIEESFKKNAQMEKSLEVTRDSLKNNSKIILTDKGISPQLIIGELPLKK